MTWTRKSPPSASPSPARAGDEEWSAYSGALGRKFLKLDAFLKSGDASPKQPEQPEQLTLQPEPEPQQK